MSIKITRTTSPGESADEASGGSPRYGSGPRDFLDNARINAREATYANTAQEKAYVAAIDAAAFDRVQKFERHLIANAEETVLRSRAVNDEADEISNALFDLSRKVHRGGISAEDAAVEYESLRRQAEAMRGRIARTLQVVETDYRKVEDPYNHAQRILSKMPMQSVNPLNPSAFIKQRCGGLAAPRRARRIYRIRPTMTSHDSTPISELRSVPGFPGYRIDRNGTVYSKRSGRPLQARMVRGLPCLDLRPRPTVGITPYVSVALLVARAFVPMPRPLYHHREVIHRDGDTDNCHASNLRWVRV